MDLDLQYAELEIDHIIPIAKNGKDDENNFALVHTQCNRQKGPSDLRVAKLLLYFNKMEEELKKEKNRGVTLGDLLRKFGGAEKTIKIIEENDHIRMSIDGEKGPKIIECPLYLDKLSGMKTFFTMLPLKYLHHDDRINPRSIGSNIRGLIE
jgi:hypothetical protein